MHAVCRLGIEKVIPANFDVLVDQRTPFFAEHVLLRCMHAFLYVSAFARVTCNPVCAHFIIDYQVKHTHIIINTQVWLFLLSYKFCLYKTFVNSTELALQGQYKLWQTLYTLTAYRAEKLKRQSVCVCVFGVC